MRRVLPNAMLDVWEVKQHNPSKAIGWVDASRLIAHKGATSRLRDPPFPGRAGWLGRPPNSKCTGGSCAARVAIVNTEKPEQYGVRDDHYCHHRPAMAADNCIHGGRLLSEAVVLSQRERGILRQMIALLTRQAQCPLLHLASSFSPSRKAGGYE